MWGSDHVCKEFWIPAYGFWELLWKERLWCSTLAAGPRAKGFPEKQRNAIRPKQSQKVGGKCNFSLFVRILSVQGDKLDSFRLTSWIQSFVSNKRRLGVLNWFCGGNLELRRSCLLWLYQYTDWDQLKSHHWGCGKLDFQKKGTGKEQGFWNILNRQFFIFYFGNSVFRFNAQRWMSTGWRLAPVNDSLQTQTITFLSLHHYFLTSVSVDLVRACHSCHYCNLERRELRIQLW